MKIRTRRCDQPSPSNGGNFCYGYSSESVVCNLKDCGYSGFEKYPRGQNCPIGSVVATLGKCKDASAVLGLTYMGNVRSSDAPAGCYTKSGESIFNAIVEPSQTNPDLFGARGGVCVKGPTINCEWNEWQIGDCSQTCGDGTRTKIRAKKIQDTPNGSCEGDSEIQEPCHMEDCPNPCSHCFPSQGYTDGPCKPYPGYPTVCTNQGDNADCSPNQDFFDGSCIAN